MKTKVAVIGSGISGITTAVLLQSFGYESIIYSASLPSSEPKDPKFGSLFPSASVIPHSVFHPQLNQIFNESNALFEGLYKSNFPGLAIHNHFELFGFKRSTPDYAYQIQDFKKLSDLSWSPTHPEISIQSGYRFNSFFADWNIYFQFLINLFLNKGGRIIQKKIDLNSTEKLTEDILINCSGLGAHKLKNESNHPLLLKGHLVKVIDTPPLTSPDGYSVSYNFTPGAEIYSDSNQTPLDVYCYPRQKDWILGGSRFEGTLNKKGDWVTNDRLSETFPQQIEQINSEILEHTFGLNIDDFGEKEYQHSYRYVRNKVEGLRLQQDQNSEKLVVHNYGHGGAGVTLSWGCAFRLLNIIQQQIESKNHTIEEVIEKLSNNILKR